MMNDETRKHWQEVIERHPVLKGWTICDENEITDAYPFMKRAIENFNMKRPTTVFFKLEDNSEIRYRMVLYTRNYVYYFFFNGDYMNCGYDSRTELPLESWKRGGDLSDGKANKDTLFEILCDIVAVESVKCPDFTVSTDEYGNTEIKY